VSFALETSVVSVAVSETLDAASAISSPGLCSLDVADSFLARPAAILTAAKHVADIFNPSGVFLSGLTYFDDNFLTIRLTPETDRPIIES
jgi:hypothetical protein